MELLKSWYFSVVTLAVHPLPPPLWTCLHYKFTEDPSWTEADKASDWPTAPTLKIFEDLRGCSGKQCLHGSNCTTVKMGNFSHSAKHSTKRTERETSHLLVLLCMGWIPSMCSPLPAFLLPSVRISITKVKACICGWLIFHFVHGFCWQACSLSLFYSLEWQRALTHSCRRWDNCIRAI